MISLDRTDLDTGLASSETSTRDSQESIGLEPDVSPNLRLPKPDTASKGREETNTPWTPAEEEGMRHRIQQEVSSYIDRPGMTTSGLKQSNQIVRRSRPEQKVI